MRTPDEVAAMLRLRALGWGERRIATTLGCSRGAVRRYLAAEGWVSYRRSRRAKRLDGLQVWLGERFFRHRGNADVVRQDLEREQGLRVSLRTVERAVKGLRQSLAAEARATLSFETPPGRPLADRLPRDPGLNRRRACEASPVRGDARLFAAGVCARLPA